MPPNDESNPFASHNPWPKMPSAPMRVGPVRRGAEPASQAPPRPSAPAPTPAYVRPMNAAPPPASATPPPTASAAIRPAATQATPEPNHRQPEPPRSEPLASPAPAWTPRARDTAAKPRGFSVAAVAASVAAVVGIGALAVVLSHAPPEAAAPQVSTPEVAEAAAPTVVAPPVRAAVDPSATAIVASPRPAPVRLAQARRRPIGVEPAPPQQGGPVIEALPPPVVETPPPLASAPTQAPAAATAPPPTAAARPPADPDAPMVTRPTFSE